MSYLTPEQMADGSALTLLAGQKAEVIMMAYEPFQTKSGVKMPKHIAVNAKTNAKMEFVGFKFHNAIKPFNEQIEAETVVEVSCIENGTDYPDYHIKIASKATGGDF
jgi:hypothetical protein